MMAIILLFYGSGNGNDDAKCDDWDIDNDDGNDNDSDYYDDEDIMLKMIIDWFFFFQHIQLISSSQPCILKQIYSMIVILEPKR